MTDEAQLNAGLAQLREKFLARTRGEMAAIRAQAEAIRGGDAGAFATLEQLAHRIYGTGATLGFDALSGCAGKIERLAEAAKKAAAVDPQTLLRLESYLGELEEQLKT